MVPIWLAVILAVAGFAVWMWRKENFNLYNSHDLKEAAITATVVACTWLCWWQVGIPFLNWEAGNFNIGVFGLAWLVPVILDSMIPKKKK